MQLQFVCPTTVSSTDATAAATTGGPFELPAWAPDIEWAITSQNNEWLVMTASTSPLPGATTVGVALRKASIASYTKRTFGLVPAAAAVFGNKTTMVLLTYRAAGELVRT